MKISDINKCIGKLVWFEMDVKDNYGRAEDQLGVECWGVAKVLSYNKERNEVNIESIVNSGGIYESDEFLYPREIKYIYKNNLLDLVIK